MSILKSIRDFFSTPREPDPSDVVSDQDRREAAESVVGSALDGLIAETESDAPATKEPSTEDIVDDLMQRKQQGRTKRSIATKEPSTD